MAIIRNRFYFGSAGDVQALPAQVRGANTSPNASRYGAAGRAYNGRPTIVSYGFRRTWPLKWPYRPHDDANVTLLQRMEQVYRCQIPRRAYLLDTRNRNFCPPDTATAGGEEDTDNFLASSGTLLRLNSPSLSVDLMNMCEGYLQWNSPSSGSGQTLRSLQHMPVIPGSQYLLSGYLGTPGSGQVKLTFFFYDKDRTFVSAVQSGSAITLGAVTRYSFSLSSASVPAGAATFVIGVTTSATTTSLYMTGLMVQYDESTLIPWQPGAGSAEVVVDSFTPTYTDSKGREITAVLLEV